MSRFDKAKSWFANALYTSQKVETKIEVIRVESANLTLEQWRKTPSLITAAMKLCNDPTFKMMMDVMRNESLTNYVPRKEGENANADLQTLGKIRGYQLALNNLESFVTPLNQSKPLVASFPSSLESKE